MLRWLRRSPESFLPGQEDAPLGSAQLPMEGSGVLRFDTRAIYNALQAQRSDRGMTWVQVTAEAGVPDASSLTRLQKGGRVTFPLVMRITMWLGQLAANFVRVSEL
jgi:hypothetical protein